MNEIKVFQWKTGHYFNDFFVLPFICWCVIHFDSFNSRCDMISTIELRLPGCVFELALLWASHRLTLTTGYHQTDYYQKSMNKKKLFSTF